VVLVHAPTPVASALSVNIPKLKIINNKEIIILFLFLTKKIIAGRPTGKFFLKINTLIELD
jgi:hypothetical protein